MNNNELYTTLAAELFSSGYNCPQASFGAMAAKVDLEQTLALKIATPFGGGISHSGLVCGAVSGALMGLGYYYGNAYVNREAKQRNYEIGELFMTRFRERFGDVLCPKLLDLDIRIPEELAKARELDLFHTRCKEFVSGAVEIACQIIDEEAPPADVCELKL